MTRERLHGAAAAADEAIREGAEIIVGPLTSGSTSAIAPVARKANVPVLTFSNDRRIAGNGVYLMSFLPEQEIDRIVAFAASKGKRASPRSYRTTLMASSWIRHFAKPWSAAGAAWSPSANILPTPTPC